MANWPNGQTDFLTLLTLSGLPLIPVTSLTGMLKKEVSFLSWLIVIWVRWGMCNSKWNEVKIECSMNKVASTGDKSVTIAHRKFCLQLRFVKAGESFASVSWLKMGRRQ